MFYKVGLVLCFFRCSTSAPPYPTMHFSSALAIVAAAATAAHAFALPASIGTAYSAVAFNITERDLATRSCKRLDPSLVLSYFQEHPTWNAWGTAVSKKAGSGQASITGRTALAFSGIPSGAQGCLLHYALPNNNKQYATGDAHTVNGTLIPKLS